MTATMTRTCPMCGNEIPPSNYFKIYCSGLCRRRQNKRTQDARKRAMRGQIEREATAAKQRKAKRETAAIVHDPDRENKPARVSKMTEAEFVTLLAGQPMPKGERPMRELMVRKLQARRAA